MKRKLESEHPFFWGGGGGVKRESFVTVDEFMLSRYMYSVIMERLAVTK